MKAFDKFCTILDKIATVITSACIIFLTLLITAAVIARGVFDAPIAWQYEATLVCLSWVVFIGMSITFKLDEHMRLSFVYNPMSPKMRNIWLAIMDLIVLLFLIYAGYQSIAVVENAMPTMYQTIPVTRGLFYLPFPIGCFFSICHIINTNYKRLTGQSTPGSSEA